MARKKKLQDTVSAEWRVNTPALLNEIIQYNSQVQVLVAPIRIFAHILAQVGERAAELNDPMLNKLMARLSIYAETDPYNEHYSKEATERLLSYNSPQTKSEGIANG